MDNAGYYDGSDLKFELNISVTGFDQGKDEYNVDVYCGSEIAYSFNQGDVKRSDDKFYLPVPADNLVPGPLKIVVTAFVPDSDFDSGYRKEIAVRNLRYIKTV